MAKSKRSKVKKQKKPEKEKEVKIEEEEEEEDLFLIRFMKDNRRGQLIYQILLIIPLPFLLWILDGVFKGKIWVWFGFKKAKNIEDASHVLILSTAEKKTSIVEIGKERLFLGNKAERDFITIHFNNQRFVYDLENSTFVSLHKTYIGRHIEKFVKKYRYGLKTKDWPRLKETWGGNSLRLDYMDIKDIMIDSMTHPFGVWEIFGLLVCIYDMGMFCTYTLCVWYFFIRGLISAVQDTLEVQAKMRAISEINSSVIVIRENEDKTFTKNIVGVDDLMPGDLIEVIANLPVPADCVLVNGECVMQESMLTGESTPVLKAPYQMDEAEDRSLPMKKITDKNILYAGSTTMYTKGGMTDTVLAVVVATGFYTEKGSLIQKMVEPESRTFTFFEDAFDSMLLLLMLSCSTSIYFFYYRFFIVDDMNPPTLYTMVIQITTIFLIVAKPSIPQCLFVGLEYSVGRLKEDNVSVMNQMNLADAAWVDTVCFDKTGTLTRNQMKMFGFLKTRQDTEKYDLTEEEQRRELEHYKNILEQRANRVIKMKMMMEKLGNQRGMIQENPDDSVINQDEFEKIKEKPLLTKQEAFAVVKMKLRQIHIRSREEKNRDQMIARLLKEKENQMKAGIRKYSSFDLVQKRFDNRIINNKSHSLLMECFGMCNSLIKIGKKMVGDPLEVEMFRYSPFNMRFVTEMKLVPSEIKVARKDEVLVKYYVPDIGAQALSNRVYRQCKVFDFTNKSRRMTVVVAKYLDGKKIQNELRKEGKVVIENIQDLNSMTILTKGAPETIGMLCTTESLPEDYNQKDNELSSQGLKVLSLAGKEIQLKSMFEREELWEDKENGKVRRVFNESQLKALQSALNDRDEEIEQLLKDDNREVLEDSMKFLCLYMMENPLQGNALRIIKTLKSQNILSKIITGDNLFTALNVATAVKILGEESPVYIGESQANKKGKIRWVRLDQFFQSEDEEGNPIEKQIFKIDEIRQKFKELLENEFKERIFEQEAEAVQTRIRDFKLSKIDFEPEIESESNIKKYDDNDDQVEYDDIDEQSHKSLKKSLTSSEMSESQMTVEDQLKDAHFRFHQEEPNLVMTGNAFDQVIMDKLKLPDINMLNDYKIFSKFMKTAKVSPKFKADLYFFGYSSKVYGRCSSHQKMRIINFLKYFKVNTDRTLAFVGDGNNDLQAIKSADFAVKLGHSELSTSTSFVSDDSDLSSLLILINEAKCMLSNGYHNFSMVIFFCILEFVCFYVLIMKGLNNNLAQIVFMDFGICNLFGFCLPAIGPRKRLKMHTPAKKLWHTELVVYLFGQLVSGLFFMFYGYEMLKRADYYIPYQDLVSDEEYSSGSIDVEEGKFLETHYLTVLTCLFSVIFCAVDNMKDSFRDGFFATRNRTIAFFVFFIFTAIMLWLPVLDLIWNSFFALVAYQFRIPIISSSNHLFVTLLSLTWSTIAFTLVSFIIKLISLYFGDEKTPRTKILQNYERKLLSLCDEGNIMK